MSHIQRARWGPTAIAAVALAAMAATGCSDGGSADEPTSPDPGSTAASAMPSPDEIVPSDPSGFGAYVAPGGRFTVDLPSGWGVTLTEGLAIARPDGGGPDSMIMIASAQVEGTDVAAVLEQLELEPDTEGRDVEVPGAATARRFVGDAFAPYDLVVAVDDAGHAAAVVVFDDGEVADQQREHVLGSLAYTGAEANGGAAAS